MNKLLKLIPVGALLPFLALAQNTNPSGVPIWGNNPQFRIDEGESTFLGTAELLLLRIGDWVRIAAAILMGVAVLVFFWGIVKYIASAGDEEARKSGRALMIWGIVGLFVMVSVWGLVFLLASIFGIQPGGGVNLPGIPGPAGGSTAS